MRLPLAAAVCLFAPALFSQPSMPAWLAPYPGAAPQIKTYPALVEMTYTAAAAPDAVADHYRKLLEAQSVTLQQNPDGAGGAVLRGSSPECNLMITVRAQAEGTFVRLNCAAKGQTIAATHSTASPAMPPMPAGIMERHQQLVAEMGIHKQRPPADAPPLVWPDWLGHINGARLAGRPGVDQSHNEYLETKYTTSEPMTALFAFYKDLLTAHEYAVYKGGVETGQTMKGVQQNAIGDVEGDNYPSGFPGPRTVIHVRFDRSYLNQPITVILRLTAYGYKGRP